MERDNNRRSMDVNLSNVFSPHRTAHVSERYYDVDFTENGNPLVETDEDRIVVEKEEIYNLKYINNQKYNQ